MTKLGRAVNKFWGEADIICIIIPRKVSRLMWFALGMITEMVFGTCVLYWFYSKGLITYAGI